MVMGYLPHYVGVGLTKSDLAKIQWKVSLKSYVLFTYPEDILISDARLWEKLKLQIDNLWSNIHTCRVLNNSN